jgi:hypothetical protein
MPTFRNTLFHLHRKVDVSRMNSHLPAYEDGKECSEMSAYKLQTPGNYPKVSIQYSGCVRLIHLLLVIGKTTRMANLKIIFTVFKACHVQMIDPKERSSHLLRGGILNSRLINRNVLFSCNLKSEGKKLGILLERESHYQ